MTKIDLRVNSVLRESINVELCLVSRWELPAAIRRGIDDMAVVEDILLIFLGEKRRGLTYITSQLQEGFRPEDIERTQNRLHLKDFHFSRSLPHEKAFRIFLAASARYYLRAREIGIKGPLCGSFSATILPSRHTQGDPDSAMTFFRFTDGVWQSRSDLEVFQQDLVADITIGE